MATLARSISEAIELALPSILQQYTKAPEDKQLIAPLILGPPSIGKTGVLTDVAKTLGLKKLVVVACGNIDPKLEFCGLPEIVRKKVENKDQIVSLSTVDEYGKFSTLDMGGVEIITKWIKPSRLAIFDDLKEDEKGLFVLDDIHLLPAGEQAMIMQLLTDGMRIHSHNIGSGNNVALLMTGNRSSDKAGSHDMLQPVINRIHLIEVEPEVRTLAKDWLQNYAIPKGVNPLIAAAVESSPKLIYDFEKDDDFLDDEVTPFASCRSWTNFGRLLDIVEEMASKEATSLKSLFPEATVDLEALFKNSALTCLGNVENFAAGVVGDKVASNFYAFYELYVKFDLEEMMRTRDFSGVSESEVAILTYKIARYLSDELLKLDLEQTSYWKSKYKKPRKQELDKAQMSEAAFRSMTEIQDLGIALLEKTGKGNCDYVIEGVRRFDDTTDPEILRTADALGEVLDEWVDKMAENNVVPFWPFLLSLSQLELRRDQKPLTLEGLLNTRSFKKLSKFYPDDLIKRASDLMSFVHDFLNFLTEKVPTRAAFLMSAFIGTYAINAEVKGKRVFPDAYLPYAFVLDAAVMIKSVCSANNAAIRDVFSHRESLDSQEFLKKKSHSR